MQKRSKPAQFKRITFPTVLKLWKKTAMSHGRGAVKLSKENLENALHATSFEMGLRLQAIRELHNQPFSSSTKSEIKRQCKKLENEIDFCCNVGIYLIHANHL